MQGSPGGWGQLSSRDWAGCQSGLEAVACCGGSSLWLSLCMKCGQSKVGTGGEHTPLPSGELGSTEQPSGQQRQAGQQRLNWFGRV